MINAKTLILLGVGLLCAVLLLIFGGTDNAERSSASVVTMTEYELSIEERLEVLISRLEGASDVSVMATLECGVEYVYATNTEKTDSIERNEYYKAGQADALLLKEISPKVMGVAVVCNGGDDPVVKTDIIQLISSVLGIPTNRIYVGS